MRVAFYLNAISPHQLPLAEAVARRVGYENFRYIYLYEMSAERKKMGWSQNVESEKFVISKYEEDRSVNDEWLENADIVYSGLRQELELFKRRNQHGLRSLYMSERWMKPIGISYGRWSMWIPGMVRMLHPAFSRMARKWVAAANTCKHITVLAIGENAIKDFKRIGMSQEKMVRWCYCVKPSDAPRSWGADMPVPLKVLWVGRMLNCKCVGTIIKAVRRIDKGAISLTLVGGGAEETRLKRLAKDCENIEFLPAKPMEEVRSFMRNFDVYVLSSNGWEGWGAALNDAMEEGLLALGTNEAGASSFMLPADHRFRAGDVDGLKTLLEKAIGGRLSRVDIGEWGVESRADKFLLIGEKK